MRTQGSYEMQGIESLGENLVEFQESRGIVSGKESICQAERIFIVEDIEVLDHILIPDFLSAECNRLVEDCQSIPHRSVCLHRYYMERFVIYGYAFLSCYGSEITDNSFHRNPVEVVCLAARQYRRQDLVFFRRGKNEYGVCRRFFQCLEKGIEGSRTQHVDLVDNVHAVFSRLGRYPHLIYQGLDVVDAVVRSGIELMDTVGTALGEGKTGFAFSARLHIGSRIGTVYGLGENTCSACLAYASRSAEQISMGKLAAHDGILEGPGYVFLSDKRFKAVRSVFSG